jgi:hypothetical protein
MTQRSLQRSQLGALTKIGQGGQGIVYDAPGFKTKFTNSMVFKEYKPEALRAMDFDALTAMPELVEESMSYEDAERLVSLAAWPCALVEDDGRPIGQVMPAIPDQFTMPLTTAKGVSQVNAEIQHLLNHSSMLQARGIKVTEVQRYSLLRAIAADLAFLHDNAICVGDISPKNLLFALSPQEASYFIDCDTMGINGISALPQVETPGWEVPQGEPLATVYSDSFKLGLLALRLLVGDQDVRDPKRLPLKTPSLLTKLITDALTQPAERRPLPTAWTHILGYAIEEAQQRQLDSPSTEEVDDDPAPPVPVVRTRPKASSQPKASAAQPSSPAATPPPAAPLTPPPPADASARGGADAHGRNRVIGAGIALAAVVAVVVVIIAVSTSSGGNSYDQSQATTSRSYSSSSEPTSEATTPPSTRSSLATQTATGPNMITLSPPPPAYFQADQDANGDTCSAAIPISSRGEHFAIRGSSGTTCLFAQNVGVAYVASNPDPTVSHDIAAHGSVDCSGVAGNPRCTNGGRDFVMTCSMIGGDHWVTCTGGNKAVVYVY